jgi:hypothetical protein
MHSPLNISPADHQKRVSFNLLSEKHDHYFLVPELEYVMEIQLAADQNVSLNGLRRRLASER